MKTSNQPPEDVQGLFRFEWGFSGKFEARLQPALARHYKELRANAKSQDFDLAWALDISSKITKKGVDSWVNGDGSLIMSMSDEDYFEEYGKSAPKTLHRRRLINIPYFRDGLTTTAKQCCEVVFEIQRSFGTDLTKLMERGMDAATKKKALTSLKKRFSKALSLLHEGKKPHGKFLIVNVILNEKIERIPLTARAIDVALELADLHLRAPSKEELRKELEKRHTDELITSRDKRDLPPVNWSDIFKQAGLNALPSRKTRDVKQTDRGGRDSQK
jgi:hypothetical protein